MVEAWWSTPGSAGGNGGSGGGGGGPGGAIGSGNRVNGTSTPAPNQGHDGAPGTPPAGGGGGAASAGGVHGGAKVMVVLVREPRSLDSIQYWILLHQLIHQVMVILRVVE